MFVYEVPGKLKVTWDAELRAIIDTWKTYAITLDEFREAVLIRGLNHSKPNNGRAWIVDSSTAEGAFSQEIQKFIETDIFPAFVKNGVKYFITINSKVAPLTRLTVRQYSASAGPLGLKLVEVNSVEDAKSWLRENG